MSEVPCVAAMLRLRREPRLCTLPMSAKAMWLQLAVRAAEEPDGILPVGTAFGLHTGIAMLIQCAEVEVKPNLDMLIAAGFVKVQGDTAIRVLGITPRGERQVEPVAALRVQEPAQAPDPAPGPQPRHVQSKVNGKRGGRPRQGETPEAAFARRQREMVMPVTGGLAPETRETREETRETREETRENPRGAENRQKLETRETRGAENPSVGFPGFPDSSKEEKRKEKQPSMTTLVGKEPENPKTRDETRETQKRGTRPVDEAEVTRITQEIGKKIDMTPQAVHRSTAIVRGWLLAGISERTIKRAVNEKLETFDGTISSVRFFDECVQQAHAKRDPLDDLPSAIKVRLDNDRRRFSDLNFALQDNLKGPPEKRSKREMEMSFAFDAPRLEWGLPPICFQSQEQFDHWKAIWDAGLWVSPYADEREQMEREARQA